MIDRGTCKAMLRESARLMLEQADRLSDIDSKFGDGDHGITITKIAKLMDERAEAWDEESIKDFLDDLGMAAMAVRGGSAGPLYGTMIGGLGARLEDDETFDLTTIKEAAAAAGMAKPSASQVYYIDLSEPDSVVVYQQKSQNVLSRALTSLGSGVCAVVEYFK